MKHRKNKKKCDAVYIIGSGKAPNWCKKKLTAYKKLNGYIGFEFHGATKTYELNVGDALLKNGRRIDIRRAVGT